jgi:ribosome-associated translation inhibitor RaiA
MIDVSVTTRGGPRGNLGRYAREQIGGLDRIVKSPILGAHVVLTQEANPSMERPARAQAEIDVNGHIVRGHVAASSMRAAVDDLAEHMRRQLDRFADRRVTRRKRPAELPSGAWRHGAWSAKRPDHFRRPPDERQILRRKSFALEQMTPTEAAVALAELDHDFYLFCDSETGRDAVVYRRDDGRLGLIEPAGVVWPDPIEDGLVREESRMSSPTSLEASVEEMNELNHRFLFFVNEEDGRGNIIYLRYDGHYGLIEPAL